MSPVLAPEALFGLKALVVKADVVCAAFDYNTLLEHLLLKIGAAASG